MNENIIEVKDLVKAYGDFRAVDGISFAQQAGECLAILGPNGAGKTTTVEILEGFRSPSSGSVTVLGVSPRQAPRSWRDQVGVVLQSIFASSTLTVKEEIALAATTYADPYPVEEVIDIVGLRGKEKSRVGTLSGGQRRRLDVALGIIGRPRLLFLDEPTTGFDPSARHEFWATIKELNQRGTSVLLTTHYLDEAEFLADRVAVIAAGKIVASGTPDTLGGEAAHLPIITWLDPHSGQVQQITSSRPTQTVLELSEQLGGDIPELQVIKPTLEDIYLQLVSQGEAA